MAGSKTWTVMSIMNWSANYLEEKNIDESKTVIEWLLCETLSCSRMDLYLQFDRPMSESELAIFRPMLLKCAANQPVQQVVGNCEFYGIKLAVNEHVLIPRPETERLVEESISLSEKIFKDINHSTVEKKEGNKTEDKEPAFIPPAELRILDIGSGSGCIAIALAMHIPYAKITAIEKSDEAVKVLKRNINFYNLEKRISVIHADIRGYRPAIPFHMIVSNPPYVAEHEMSTLDQNVSYFEPYLALSDKDNGLSFYRFFAEMFTNWMSPKGVALLEYGGNGQTLEMKKIFSAYEHRVIKDYQQDDRVFVVNMKAEA
ncbi:MAG: peptide chain release factor N(5)-glutamine methyltransferase [Candidatus Neomarinimicrobiota bacterium]|nr:MAG: peptide chain release factor N(5)-glutamine methyltransferase [Candidatus Neomarinimicrobiota bacterium]